MIGKLLVCVFAALSAAGRKSGRKCLFAVEKVAGDMVYF